MAKIIDMTTLHWFEIILLSLSLPWVITYFIDHACCWSIFLIFTIIHDSLSRDEDVALVEEKTEF